MKKNKYIYGTIAATTAITLATVGASNVSADTQYGIFLNRVTGEWQTVNRTTGEIVKSEPNGTYSTYDEANAGLSSWLETQASTVEAPKTSADVKPALDAQQAVVDATAQDATNAQADAAATNQAVVTAQADVDTATQSFEDAKKADADRDAKIKAAETEVAVKSDAVDTAKAKLTTAQNTVKTTTDALTKATDAVKSVTDALANVDTVTIVMPDTIVSDEVKQRNGYTSNVSNFKTAYEKYMKHRTSQWSLTLTGQGVKVAQASSTNIRLADKNKIVNIDNLTDEQLQELALYNLQVVNAVREQLGAKPLTLNEGSLKAAKNQADKYIARNKSIMSAGHVSGGDYFGENVSNLRNTTTMYDLKKEIYDAVEVMAFADAPSNWGHLFNTLIGAPNLGVAFATFAGQPHIINVFGVYSGIPITNPNDPTTLQAALAKAQADQSAAQAASDTAQANLVKASSDYAKALELKTQAEKTLADATATPLQTQVAENNLRLATIALQNAEARKADAQKAVDNFSADLATKKAALDTAKADLAQAQATATAKAEALETAKANLATQQATLDSLNKDKDALLAEKDRLVEEAKALAEELDGYMNAPARLADAQATLTEKQAALTEAQAKAETAQDKLETVTAKLAEEQATLAELQAEYDKLKDLEDKAKDNVIATLPDGTIVAVPKDAPTAAEKPAIDIDAVKQALDKGQDVTVVDGKVVVTNPQAGVTVTPQGITYSRVERAKTLPNTGEQTSLLALAGVAVLSSLGLASARRRKQG